VKLHSGWGGLGAVGLMAASAVALADDTEALAKAAQNPIAAMISLPFQNDTTLNAGPLRGTQNVLNIQPVIPVKIDDEWNLITRTIVPVISQPAFAPGQERVNGFGDTDVELFLSPAKPGKLIWGLGPVLQIPTNSNQELGTKKWGIGPAVVLLTSEGHWLYGVVANNIWSFAGPSNAAPINQMLVQPFVNYNFSEGWYATTSPIITANWEAANDNRWTVPLGGGFGKIFKIEGQAMNGQLQAFYNVVSPDNTGGNWTIRAQLQLLFPK
jgi:hypothetical protein